MLMYHFSNNKPINSNASLPFNNEYSNSRELSFFPTPSLFYSHLVMEKTVRPRLKMLQNAVEQTNLRVFLEADIPEDRLYKMPRLCMMYFLNKKKKKINKIK